MEKSKKRDTYDKSKIGIEEYDASKKFLEDS